jgi:peptidyl-prolyl cis-trans isomerase B (cyclophilin B)
LKRLLYPVLMFSFLACANADTTATDTTPVGTDSAVSTSSAASTTDTSATTGTDTAGTTSTTAQPAAAPQESKSMGQGKIAELHTTAGQIDIRFYPELAPGHVDNFISLAEKGFYDGTKFHRVIPGFMIQGGDPNSKDDTAKHTWGTGGSGTNIKAEFSSTPHKRGIVSMARSTHPDSASSQFFIVVKDAPSLDNSYTVFGEVVKGMDVADKIVSAKRNANDRPDEPTAITKIVIRDAREGETASQ